jgi:hypothetical protein
MNDKPRLGFWQFWNMSFGLLGIQFGWGLQMANMSAIYEYLGACIRLALSVEDGRVLSTPSLVPRRYLAASAP